MSLLIWAGAIFALSSVPNPPGPSGPDQTAYAAHATEYAVLALLAWRWARPAFPGSRRALVLVLVWSGCVAYGASDELHQAFVPHRDASYLDLTADAAGAALSLIGWQLFRAVAARGRRGTGAG